MLLRYLGSRLVPKLLDLGKKVICVDNLIYEPTSLVIPASKLNCELHIGDCRDKELMAPFDFKSRCYFPTGLYDRRTIMRKG